MKYNKTTDLRLVLMQNNLIMDKKYNNNKLEHILISDVLHK